MAMNKKEQAEFEAAKKAVIVARALNWSEPVARDVFPSSSSAGDVRGFTFNTYSNEVLYALSGAVGHATSDDKFPVKTSRQNSISMFSTKLRALKALRHSAEKECAERLAKIDMQIQAEQQQPTADA
jgi:hypothetical protein